MQPVSKSYLTRQSRGGWWVLHSGSGFGKLCRIVKASLLFESTLWKPKSGITIHLLSCVCYLHQSQS